MSKVIYLCGTIYVPKYINFKVYLLIAYHINPLKTNRRQLYLNAQSIPRCKHFSSRL